MFFNNFCFKNAYFCVNFILVAILNERTLLHSVSWRVATPRDKTWKRAKLKIFWNCANQWRFLKFPQKIYALLLQWTTMLLISCQIINYLRKSLEYFPIFIEKYITYRFNLFFHLWNSISYFLHFSGLKVIAMGTGTKCSGESQLSSQGKSF